MRFFFRFAITLLAPAALGAPPIDLRGIVDLHVHTNPDSDPPRRTDIFEIARTFKQAGVRAFVIKSHYMPTAQLAYAVNQAIPDTGAYGGLVLNLSVGGMNPYAVEHFAKVTGNYAKVVWMPTMDAENFVKRANQNRPFVRVFKDGALLPETIEVLKVIQKHNLTLATGHLTAEEALVLLREAKKLGVQHMIVTHPLPWPVYMTVPQMKQAAEMGAYLEFVYNLIYPDPEAAARSSRPRLGFGDYVKAIHEVGAAHCFLSSDVGQPMRPIQTDAWREYLSGLMKAGLTSDEVNILTRRNPARAIGLK